MTLLRTKSVESWEERTEEEVTGIAIRTEDESITYRWEEKQAEKWQRGWRETQGQGSMILRYLYVN